MQSKNLSIDQFCDQVGVGRTKAYELINSGELKAKKIGRRTIIPRSCVEAWQESLPDYLETNGRAC